MNFPNHLSHKPIIGVDDYDKVDGIYSGHSDAKAISIGKAQYDQNAISAKVWRNNGSEWKRTSEELPLHRVLDLALLIVSLYYPRRLKLPPEIAKYSNHLPAVTKEAAHLNSRIAKDSNGNDELQFLYDYLKDNDEIMNGRLKALKDLLNSLNI